MLDNNETQFDEQQLLNRHASIEARLWIDSNTSRIDEILRNNYDKTVEAFSEIVLTSFAEVMNSIRGAFFVVNYEEDAVCATAGYACTLDSMVKKKFKIGEDLIGFAVKSKKMRVLDHLPLNNAMINSGLAQISSTCVIVTPLVFNDVVYGVIELHNLISVEPKYLELIERLSRNIASTLQSIQNNMKTQSLLTDLKLKTEQMLAQEEELRQNLEELAAIRDEMERRQEELQTMNDRLTENEQLMREAVDQSIRREAELKEKEVQIALKESKLTELKQELDLIAGRSKAVEDFKFADLFDLDEIQAMQDAFAYANGVASLITEVDGTPITKPSNFSHLCEKVIRCTEKGVLNCKRSDATLGTKFKKGAAVQPCLSGGLWDGGAGIFIGDVQIANWLFGQVLPLEADEQEFVKYANEIGADEAEFKEALKSVTRMPIERFRKIADFLYLMAQQLSKYAVQTYVQASEIARRTNEIS